MSEENVNETTEAPKKPSDECKKEIAEAVTAIRKLSDEDALAQLNSYRTNEEQLTEANPAWVKKNLRYAIQAEILTKHGFEETPRVAANRAESEAQDPTKQPPATKGRKRMNLNGTFKLDVGDPPNLGREGSAKGKILRSLSELGSEFTHEQFRAAVAEAYQWNQETESFDGDTKFPTIAAATGAWFSELRNKAKVIVQVSGQEEPEPETAQAS